MSFKKYKDLWFGIIALAFSVFYLVVGSQIVTRPKLTPSYASAKVVPRLLGSLLALLSVLLIIQAVRTLHAAAATGGAEAETGEKATRDDLLTVVLTLGVILLYIILLPALGFCLSSIIYLFAQMVIMAPKGKRSYVKFAIIAVAFTMVAFFAFRVGLQQLLPRGVIESLLGF